MSHRAYSSPVDIGASAWQAGFKELTTTTITSIGKCAAVESILLTGRTGWCSETAAESGKKRALESDDDANKPSIFPTSKPPSNDRREEINFRCEAEKLAKSLATQIVGKEYESSQRPDGPRMERDKRSAACTAG